MPCVTADSRADIQIFGVELEFGTGRGGGDGDNGDSGGGGYGDDNNFSRINNVIAEYSISALLTRKLSTQYSEPPFFTSVCQ